MLVSIVYSSFILFTRWRCWSAWCDSIIETNAMLGDRSATVELTSFVQQLKHMSQEFYGVYFK